MRRSPINSEKAASLALTFFSLLSTVLVLVLLSPTAASPSPPPALRFPTGDGGNSTGRWGNLGGAGGMCPMVTLVRWPPGPCPSSASSRP